MATVPTDISALREQSILQITWGEQVHQFKFTELRGHCECAHCVNEWTGERILDIDSIPADISIKNIELVGNYAIRIHWSDNHNTGLYTWQRLQELCS